MKPVSSTSLPPNNGTARQTRILHLPPRQQEQQQQHAGQDHSDSKRYLAVGAQHSHDWTEDAAPSDETQQGQTLIKVSVKKSRRAIGKD